MHPKNHRHPWRLGALAAAVLLIAAAPPAGATGKPAPPPPPAPTPAPVPSPSPSPAPNTAASTSGAAAGAAARSIAGAAGTGTGTGTASTGPVSTTLGPVSTAAELSAAQVAALRQQQQQEQQARAQAQQGIEQTDSSVHRSLALGLALPGLASTAAMAQVGCPDPQVSQGAMGLGWGLYSSASSGTDNTGCEVRLAIEQARLDCQFAEARAMRVARARLLIPGYVPPAEAAVLDLSPHECIAYRLGLQGKTLQQQQITQITNHITVVPPPADPAPPPKAAEPPPAPPPPKPPKKKRVPPKPPAKTPPPTTGTCEQQCARPAGSGLLAPVK